MNRFFAELLPLEKGGAVVLDPQESHHALNVLRLGPGAKVELFDGQGHVAVATLAGSRKGQASVTVEEALPVQLRVGPAVHLIFAVPKGKRLDWLLEKATELGATSLRSVRTTRCVAGTEDLSTAQKQRWLGHCVSAAKQAGLNFLPQIFAPADLAEVLASGGDRFGLMGSVAQGAMSVPQAIASGRCGRDVCILVGPEGGLTGQEEQAAAAAGFVPVRIGHTTLRVETAAIALLAATMAICE